VKLSVFEPARALNLRTPASVRLRPATRAIAIEIRVRSVTRKLNRYPARTCLVANDTMNGPGKTGRLWALTDPRRLVAVTLQVTACPESAACTTYTAFVARAIG
jgi:hypothetical protein